LSRQETSHLLSIANTLNAPVFCDVQNPLRFQDFPQNIMRYDLLLEAHKPQPKTILHFGGPITSKNLNHLIANFEGQYVQIHSFAENLDSSHSQKTILSVTAQEFAQNISDQKFTTNSLMLDLKEKALKLEKILHEEFRSDLNEMNLFHHLSQTQAQYFIGSSMPIRDLERFTGISDGNYFFNRGASGIDGNIATAHGLALKSPLKTICILGDQAFLYDVNALSLHRQTLQAVHTIVVNNQGGGIFSFLPAKKIDDQDAFQKFFTNPHEWDLSKAADLFGLKYILAKTPQDLQKAVENKEPTLIEIKSEIDSNVQKHRDLTAKIKALL
jgi:2-succinyl-5-enolpyruvyl-6-hydroxy-3-cyclohexene-1-carboxylate synthase